MRVASSYLAAGDDALCAFAACGGVWRTAASRSDSVYRVDSGHHHSLWSVVVGSDFIVGVNFSEKEGGPRVIAIRQASPVRIKAMVMNTFTAFIVIVRLAFFPETGMDTYSPIATVILGGLLISTLLTLVVVPVVYPFVDDVTQLLKRRAIRRTF